MTDVIAQLAGLEPGSPIDSLRGRREQARTQSEASFDALFHPADPGDVPLTDRLAIAAFSAGIQGQAGVATFYADAYAAAHGPSAVQAAVRTAYAEAAAHGPYGRYPAGPLTTEDQDGPEYRVGVPLRQVLGPRLVAAFEHAHMLVLHPRDASPRHLQALLDAGWTTPGVVTLSQLVSFLSYQVRIVHGLRVLAAAGPGAAP